MIMPRGEPLLMPAGTRCSSGPVCAGLAINMLPLGRVVWMPDLVMVLLVFWGVHQPTHWHGRGVCAGPVHGREPVCAAGASTRCLHVLSFGAIAIHRRLLWFSVPSRALQVFPLFAMAHAIELIYAWRLAEFSGVLELSGPVPGGAVVAPGQRWVLLAPQRRAAKATKPAFVT